MDWGRKAMWNPDTRFLGSWTMPVQDGRQWFPSDILGCVVQPLPWEHWREVVRCHPATARKVNNGDETVMLNVVSRLRFTLNFSRNGEKQGKSVKMLAEARSCRL